MKFSEMKYQRPDVEAVKEALKKSIEALKNAQTYEEAKKVFLEVEENNDHFETMMTLTSIRHSINTKDEFYDEEQKFFNRVVPELMEYLQQYNLAMLESKFRPDFAKEYGDLMFINTELSLKTFSPEIIAQLQQENQVADDYESLLASAQISFEGKTFTLAQLEPLKHDPDDARRLAAWKAEGQWYKENQAKLDEQYDILVKLRDEMGRKLGFDNYLPMGYCRMGRNCYTKEDVEKFRAAVVKYLVPVADATFRQQAARLGKPYPLTFADAALAFRSGNPKPQGSPEEILAQGKKFYDELSPETSVFFNTMLDGQLLDVLSTEGKASGGYCTGLPDYKVPFIFANFNGTQGDVEVITHEAGHAFALYMNRDRVPGSYRWPSMEACEVHSMSMEFFAWPWTDGFFGKDQKKYLYSHLSGAIRFIPYGTMVDHFQHSVFENPSWTPRQRHDEWKRLLGIYMPWLKLDGDIPFYAEGEGWQRQHHIYSSPLYYIDYCLAQTVSLEFWAMIQKDVKNAWKHYMDYTVQGGSKTFTDLLKNADLVSPFNEECLRGVCADAMKWLENYDMTGIE